MTVVAAMTALIATTALVGEIAMIEAATVTVHHAKSANQLLAKMMF
jgi:hypothetical protein